MKFFSCDREAVALLANSALTPPEAAVAEHHLADCPACRAYFQKISALCAEHSTANVDLPNPEVSPRLRGRIMAAVRSGSGRRSEGFITGRGIGWTHGVTATLACLILIGGSWVLFRQQIPPVAAPITTRHDSERSPKPVQRTAGQTLMSYRLALNRSPDAFEVLLSQESGRSSSESFKELRLGFARLDPDL